MTNSTEACRHNIGSGKHFADLPSLLDDISSFVPWGERGE